MQSHADGIAQWHRYNVDAPTMDGVLQPESFLRLRFKYSFFPAIPFESARGGG
jgi:hypothetical protein